MSTTSAARLTLLLRARSRQNVNVAPNAGPVMAAGAGSLGLILGGPAIYHGRMEERPPLGDGVPARGPDIARAVRLLRRASALWLVVYLAGGLLSA